MFHHMLLISNVSIAFAFIIGVALREYEVYNNLPHWISGTTQCYNKCLKHLVVQSLLYIHACLYIHRIHIICTECAGTSPFPCTLAKIASCNSLFEIPHYLTVCACSTASCDTSLYRPILHSVCIPLTFKWPDTPRNSFYTFR